MSKVSEDRNRLLFGFVQDIFLSNVMLEKGNEYLSIFSMKKRGRISQPRFAERSFPFFLVFTQFFSITE